MKVFVAGATGVVGWRAVRELVAAGHEVTAVARTPEKADKVRGLGAAPVALDIFDPAAVAGAVAGHDAVVNLATSIPPAAKAALPGAWAENDRIRSEASANLVDAALATGAGVYVQESIAFIYPDRGDEWIDEAVPVDTVRYIRSTLDAEASAARFTASGGRGIVLRFGLFYGPDSHHTADAAAMVRAGLFASPGAPDGYVSSITTDDAARAVVAALDAPAGTYNVVDDEPVTREVYSAALAAAVGVAPPRPIPALLAKAGGSKTALLARSQRISNRRFKAATGWAPATRSVVEGWAAAVAGLPYGGAVRSPLLARVSLAFLAISAAQVGLWAALFPRAFYDDFPLGRAWIAADGPYNEHLVRDVGELNLALLVLSVAGLVRFGPTLARVVAGTWLAYGVPHLVYHLRHTDLYSGSDLAGNIGGLTLLVIVPIMLLVSVREP